jgi:hypothetical protein
MNPIWRPTKAWRSLTTYCSVVPRLGLPLFTAATFAGCDANRALAPDEAALRSVSNAETVAASAVQAEWEPIRIEVSFNFLTGESFWTSSGAFVDFGFIDLGGTQPRFSPGTFKLEKVVSPIVASDGSTITWTFAKTHTFTSETTLTTKAQWHIVSGTGRFAGIEGHGDLVGTLDIVTGAINDVFTGWVRWP